MRPTLWIRFGRAPRSHLTSATLGGLAVGALGLVIQFVADPAKFGVFPLGLLLVAGAAAIVWLGERWYWSPLIAVALGSWITVGGTLSGDLPANLASSEPLTVGGNVVMVVGLIGSAVVGAVAFVRSRRQGQRHSHEVGAVGRDEA
jgi:hypothetical protein